MNEHAIRSALARPYHGYFEFIHEKAAALVHGIVSNHGFVDGNKRTALILAVLLVESSGYELFVEDTLEFADVITCVAQGDMSLDELVS